MAFGAHYSQRELKGRSLKKMIRINNEWLESQMIEGV